MRTGMLLARLSQPCSKTGVMMNTDMMIAIPFNTNVDGYLLRPERPGGTSPSTTTIFV